MADVASRDELLAVLSNRALKGNVAAIKALLEELRRDADESEGSRDGFAAFDDEVSQQRRKSA